MKDKFLNNSYKWIKWITVIDTGKKWKNIAITAINHWNEPVWLEIFNYLINDFWIKNKIKWWKIFFIALNLKAYKNYIKDWDKHKHRFVDDNFNRVWNKKYKNNSYEFNRREELKFILEEVDILFDIHSVSKWDDTIGISDIKCKKDAMKFFDVEKILLDDMKRSWALIWYMFSIWKIWYWLEAWNHISKNWFHVWIKNILNYLIYMWFIDGKIINNYNNVWIYRFLEEIIVKSDNFSYIKKFSNKSFHKILYHEKIAYDWKIEVLQNYKGKNIYIWFVKNVFIKWDWAWFLFKKIKN